MKHALILVAILGALFLTPGCAFAEGDLRPELERAFNAYFSVANEVAPIFQESEGALSGKLPAVPPEYPTPDYIGSIVINAENCKVSVKYNAETESVEHRSSASPLIGGLKRGKNAISINVEPLSAESAKALKSTGPPHAEVEVVVYFDQGGSSAKVFHFETDRLGKVNKEFEVTDEIITKVKQMSLRPIR